MNPIFIELYPSSKRQFKKFANEYAIEQDIDGVHPYDLGKLNPEAFEALSGLKGKSVLLECTGLATQVITTKTEAYKVLDVKLLSTEEESLGLTLKFPIKTYELQTKDYEWVEGDLDLDESKDRTVDAQFYWELTGFKFVGRVQDEI